MPDLQACIFSDYADVLQLRESADHYNGTSNSSDDKGG